MFRHLQIAAALLAVAVGMSPDRAPAAEFDCRAFLRATSEMLRNGASADVHLHSRDGAIPPEADAVDLDEFAGDPDRFHPIIKLLPRSTETGTETVACALLRVSFATSDAGAPLEIDIPYEDPAKSMTLLLLKLEQDSNLQEGRIKKWKDNGYRLPLILDGTASGLRSPNLNKKNSFRTNDFLGGRPKDVRFLEVTQNSSAMKTLPEDFQPGQNETAPAMAILCSPFCGQIAEAATLKPATPAGPSTTDADRLRGSAGIKPGAVDPSRFDPKDAGAAATHPPKKKQAASGHARSGGADKAETGNEADTMASVTIPRLTWRADDTKQDISFSFSEFGGLPCLLVALGADIFDPKPTCNTRHFNSLRKKSARVKLLDDKGWLVFQRTLRQVVVHLPAGQDSIKCLMNLSYKSAAGKPVELRLEPHTSRSKFTAAITEKPQLHEDRYVFDIKVSKPADCGAPGRKVQVAHTGEVLELPLAERPPRVARILYVPLINETGLKDRFDYDSAARRELGRAVLQSIKSAHARAAQERKSALWTLRSAELISLSPGQGARRIVHLKGSGLRLHPDTMFDQTARAGLEAIADDLLVFSSGELVRLLKPKVQETANSDRLALVFIGAFKEPSAFGSDICDTTRLRDVAKGLKRSVSPGTRLLLYAFPIVKADAGKNLRLAKIDLLAFNPALSGLPSEMIACRSEDPTIRIFPFLADAWRDKSERNHRFGTALADRLAMIVDSLVSGQEMK